MLFACNSLQGKYFLTQPLFIEKLNLIIRLGYLFKPSLKPKQRTYKNRGAEISISVEIFF